MLKVNFHQKAIIFNSERKFLVLKASYKDLRWDLPGGGVELPEEHGAALRREIQEEAGITVEDFVPLQVTSGYNTTEDAYYLFIGYTCTALSEKVTLSNEHTEYQWVTKEEFLQLDVTPYLKDFVNLV